MDLYFERHDGCAVTCDDFVQAMQDASGVNLTQFRHWYSQAGTPLVSARGHYDAAARTYTLDVEQTLPLGNGSRRRPPLHIPCAVGLVGPDGNDIPIRLAGEPATGATTRMLELTKSTQRFAFVDVPVQPVPSLFRGFSAPVRVAFDCTDRDLALLASHDSDPVNRWDAAQRSFVEAILALAAAHRRGEEAKLPATLQAIVGALLDDREADPALIALALALPDPAYVASLEPMLDPDGVMHAWTFIERSLAIAHRGAFERAYAAHRPTAPYAPTPQQIAARSLSNRCLRYLGALDDAPAHLIIERQYRRADNMTDAMAALAALRDSSSPVREQLYAAFEARWRDEPLALDQWFTLHASSLRADVLDTVRSLIAHPRFNARNPNRVRSLVGAFALGNFAAFHAPDGSGYAFAADQVRTLDATNPQLASTIAGAFNLWKRFAEPRRSTMQRCLARIARTPKLSPDVGEVVTRTLAN
jgi:aminopeptidase N